MDRADNHLVLAELPKSFCDSTDSKEVHKSIQDATKIAGTMMNSIMDITPKNSDYGKLLNHQI